MPGVLPMDYTLEHSELAKRQIRLLEAKIIGEPHPHPDSDPEVQGLLFDIIARSADTAAVNGKPLTIQWRFPDADPWHVVVANGSTRAEPGVESDPDLTWETTWSKWIGLTKGTVDPKRAILSRDLRFHGKLRELYRFTKAFPRRRSPTA